MIANGIYKFVANLSSKLINIDWCCFYEIRRINSRPNDVSLVVMQQTDIIAIRRNYFVVAVLLLLLLLSLCKRKLA